MDVSRPRNTVVESREMTLSSEERDQALRNYQAELDSLLKQSLGDSAYARFQAGYIERYFGN